MIASAKLQRRIGRVFLFLAITTLSAAVANGQGIVVPGVGPINRSMAGAAVAAPIDAAGAIHWNPASISFLERSEVSFGAEFAYPRTKLTSAIAPFGGDTNQSNSGIALLPTTAFVQQSMDSPWTFGLGLFTIGGVGANYHANPTNPVLSPPPDGAGAIFSRFAILQFAPTAALRVTDNISIGFAPTISVADVGVDPATYATPNADGSYPNGTHSRLHWGLGFQAGIYIETDYCFSFGASYKSPQWFERFEANATDAAGLPRTLMLEAEFPAIYSIGAGYHGFDRTVLAVDMRYVDFENTDFIGEPAGFGPTFEVTGLGWSSVFAVAAGAQRELTDQLTVRIGYLFTQNPIVDSAAVFNIPASAIYQHAIFLGASHKLNEKVSLSLAYYHSFRNSITGPIRAPGIGALPGSSVHVSQEIDGLVGGLNVYF